MPRLDILEHKEDILQWIEEHQSKAFMCRELKCKPETLNSYLQKMGIEYAGNKGSQGKQNNLTYKTATEYIKGNVVKSHVLKQKLIRDGLKEAKCEICGLEEWLGNPIPLELHHKDGDHFNNELENLQILCPNCHSLQGNNSGANTIVHRTKDNKCVDCGAEICRNAIRCRSCAAKLQERKVIRPDRE